MKRRQTYLFAWYLINGLLAVSILLATYSIFWEYSTRRYLKGFSDAIVPLSSPAEEKIEAILSWMKLGPSRKISSDSLEFLLRDPTTTLNYQELLKACGTATNAFLNLSNVSHLPARRLLLMDKNWEVEHVVAEVEVDGRWIVVDPSFRTILKDADGRLLTRKDLQDRSTFKQATENVPGYDPNYTYERTAHVRLMKIPIIGPKLQTSLSRLMPDWSDSILWSFLLERISFATAVVTCFVVLFLFLIRLSFRRYVEHSLSLRLFRAREKIAHVGRVLFRSRAEESD